MGEQEWEEIEDGLYGEPETDPDGGEDLLPTALEAINQLADAIGALEGRALAFVEAYAEFCCWPVKEDIADFKERIEEARHRIKVQERASPCFIDRPGLIEFLRVARSEAEAAGSAITATRKQ